MSLLSTRRLLPRNVIAPAMPTQAMASAALLRSVQRSARCKAPFQKTPEPCLDTTGGGASTMTLGSKVKAKT